MFAAVTLVPVVELVFFFSAPLVHLERPTDQVVAWHFHEDPLHAVAATAVSASPSFIAWPLHDTEGSYSFAGGTADSNTGSYLGAWGSPSVVACQVACQVACLVACLVAFLVASLAFPWGDRTSKAGDGSVFDVVGSEAGALCVAGDCFLTANISLLFASSTTASTLG